MEDTQEAIAQRVRRKAKRLNLYAQKSRDGAWHICEPDRGIHFVTVYRVEHAESWLNDYERKR